MPITPTDFVTSRRYAFHVCGASNFDAIRRDRILRSAENLLRGTAHEHLLRGKRSETVSVNISGKTVQIRDHKPLILANIEFIDLHSIDDFLYELNSRVFMWAGTATGPSSKSGKRHIEKYRNEGSVFILRAPTRELIDLNGIERLEITFCNSGSARQNDGKLAKRGRSTFMRLEQASRVPSDVVELTFKASALLPPETEYANSLNGPWLPITADA